MAISSVQISDAERKVLERVVHRDKSKKVASGATALLKNSPPLAGDLSQIAMSLSSHQLSGLEYQAALVVARSLPLGSPDAERVSQVIVDAYGKAQIEMAKTGCLVPVLQIIVGLFNSNSPAYVDVSAGYQPLFVIYIRTLQALGSSRGAAIAAFLATSQTIKRPTDSGRVAMAALPDLLKAAEGTALPTEDRESIENLVKSPRIDPAIKKLAEETLASLPRA